MQESNTISTREEREMKDKTIEMRKKICKCGHNKYEHYYSGSLDTNCRLCSCQKFEEKCVSQLQDEEVKK